MAHASERIGSAGVEQLVGRAASRGGEKLLLYGGERFCPVGHPRRSFRSGAPQRAWWAVQDSNL